MADGESVSVARVDRLLKLWSFHTTPLRVPPLENVAGDQRFLLVVNFLLGDFQVAETTFACRNHITDPLDMTWICFESHTHLLIDWNY